ncbi:aldo/keto reductase [Streptomyces sp. NPDC055897]
MNRALELGITCLDTADSYGTGHNEVLVGRAIHGRRDPVQLATRFSIDPSAGDRTRHIRGARESMLRSRDALPLRLGVDGVGGAVRDELAKVTLETVLRDVLAAR